MDILWLGDEACHDVTFTGGKASSLSRLSADYRVPTRILCDDLCVPEMGRCRCFLPGGP